MLIPGTRLRIETVTPAEIHWEHGSEKGSVKTAAGPVGLHLADLPTEKLSSGTLSFTMFWSQSARWEGKHFSVRVA